MARVGDLMNRMDHSKTRSSITPLKSADSFLRELRSWPNESRQVTCPPSLSSGSKRRNHLRSEWWDHHTGHREQPMKVMFYNWGLLRSLWRRRLWCSSGDLCRPSLVIVRLKLSSGHRDLLLSQISLLLSKIGRFDNQKLGFRFDDCLGQPRHYCQPSASKCLLLRQTGSIQRRWCSSYCHIGPQLKSLEGTAPVS